MKKLFMMAAIVGVAMALALAMTGCGSAEDEAATEGTGADISSVEIDLGDSTIYSEEDRSAAAEVVKTEFSKWDGCKLYNIRYAGDDASTDENLKWMNELAEGQDKDAAYTECIEFLSDFHSPVESEEPTAWELDTDYNDYQWWLAREDGGEWILMTNGY